jgi:siroheme synthase
MIPLPPSFPAPPSFPPGDVWLASAGPGDRRLVTLFAAHALRSTDDIVHDARVDCRDLDPARDGASIVYAGKRGGTHAHAISSPAVIVVGGTAGLRPEIASGLAGWT